MNKTIRAFTLLELLIAVAIFVAVMTAVYSSFQTGFFGYRDIGENLQVYQSASRILERLDNDLRNSFAFSDSASYFSGEKERMSFLTLTEKYSNGRLNRQFSRVSYYLNNTTLMRLCKNGKESLQSNPSVEPEELAEGVSSLSLLYGYTKGPDKPVEWLESWTDTAHPPVAVIAKVVINGKTQQPFERTIYLP
jgi:prepilin-type N-terminal cleavage/methylation domain-containing protein